MGGRWLEPLGVPRMTDWLILVAFGVAWLAGWCSRWQWEKTRDEAEEQPYDRWAQP